MTWERECANLCNVLRLHGCNDRSPPSHCRYDDTAHPALMSPGHVCSLCHCAGCRYCVDSVAMLAREKSRSDCQHQSLHLSSPAAALQPATCDHRTLPCALPAPRRETHHHHHWAALTFLPQAGLYLHCHLKWLCPLCWCIRTNIITSSSNVSVFQDTHVLDNNCVWWWPSACACAQPGPSSLTF